MNKIKLRRLKKKISDNKVKVLLISLISLSLFMGTGYAILSTRFNVGGGAEIIIEPETNCDVSFEYKEVNVWGDDANGYNYILNFIITNKTDEPIYSWTGEFEAPEDLVATSAHLNSILYSDGAYVIEPFGWNSTIERDLSVTIEIMLKYPSRDYKPKWVKINNCIVYGEGAPEINPEEPINPDVELTALKINPSEYLMAIGETAPLQVEKTPSNAPADLVWLSSDSNIVSVTDSGVITAISNGTATITVTSGNISATSAITVSGLTALSISPAEHTMAVGDTLALDVTKTPTNAPANLVWTSSDSNIVSVTESGIITAINPGIATITVTSDNISATSTITVTEAVVPPTPSDLDIQFSSPYYFEKELQFKFVITNNSSVQIKNFSFDLMVPEGSTYSLWNNPGATVTGNTFDVSLQWVTLNPGGFVEITGVINLPEGYVADDYLTPTITNIQIKD